MNCFIRRPLNEPAEITLQRYPHLMFWILRHYMFWYRWQEVVEGEGGAN
jgi:hypothetical protein